MAHLKPTKVRSVVQRWTAGRAVFPLRWLGFVVLLAQGAARRVGLACRSWRTGASQFLLGWLGLAVLVIDDVRRRTRPVRRAAGDERRRGWAAPRRLGAAVKAKVWAACLGVAGLATAGWSLARRAARALSWRRARERLEGQRIWSLQPKRQGAGPWRRARRGQETWEGASRIGTWQGGTLWRGGIWGGTRRIGFWRGGIWGGTRRIGFRRGGIRGRAAELDKGEGGGGAERLGAGKQSVAKPTAGTRQGAVPRQRIVKQRVVFGGAGARRVRRARAGEGWRLGVGWLTGVCAAAGAGVLVSALTMQPLRPPQPEPQAAPAQTQTQSAAKHTGLARAEPTKIEIPAIGVDATLLSLGVDEKNELAVPPLEHAELASWYNLGPSPGEPGSAVIVGHVDSAKIGPAVFFNLGKLKVGDTIAVTRKDGTKPAFKVDSVQTFLKTSFPTQLVYEGEQATLRVITCGGEFDTKTRNYLSNVVVFASLNP